MPRRDLVLITSSLIALGIMSYWLAVDVFAFTGFMGPDSGARFVMIHNWLQHGSPVFLDPHLHAGAAAASDGMAGYMVRLEHGTCTVYPPAFPIASGALYYLFGAPGLVVLPMLGGLLTVVFSTLAARAWGARGVWVAPLLVVATPLALYASNFWDHSIQMAITAFALWMLVRDERGVRRAALAAGLALGAGAFVHETLLLLGLCLALAAWAPKPARWARDYSLGYAASVGAWALSNAWIYGSMRGPHTQGPLDLLHPAKMHSFVDVPAIITRLTSEVAGGRGVLDLVLVMMWLAMMGIGVVRGLRWTGWLFLASAAVATYLFFDQHFAIGLFQATPWLMLAFADPSDRGVGTQRGSDLHTRIAMASAAFILLAAVTPVLPGLNWGSRYMLTAMPWMAVLAMRSGARWVEAGRDSRVRLVLALLPVAVSAFALGRGAYAYVLKLRYDRAHVEALLAAPPRENVATDLWWLPPELQASVPAPRYFLTAYVPGSSQLERPVGDLDAAVRKSFLDELDATGAKSFTFVGTRSGLAAVRAGAERRSRVFLETSERPAAELVIGQFSSVDSVSTN